MKSNKTIKSNKFDYRYIRDPGIYIDNDGIEHSLNINNNWKLLDDPSIRQVKYHKQVYEHKTITLTNKPPIFGCGICMSKVIKGKNYVSVNGIRVQDFDFYNETNYIKLPFDKHEYPINSETHTWISPPCKICFLYDGRMWMLKGAGKKSKNKNKGMRKINNKMMIELISN